MNPSDKSLEDGRGVVTKAFPSSIQAISIGSTSSTAEDVSVVSRDCEDCSKRSTCKGLFCNLQVVCHLIEGWSGYLGEYFK